LQLCTVADWLERLAFNAEPRPRQLLCRDLEQVLRAQQCLVTHRVQVPAHSEAVTM